MGSEGLGRKAAGKFMTTWADRIGQMVRIDTNLDLSSRRAVQSFLTRLGIVKPEDVSLWALHDAAVVVDRRPYDFKEIVRPVRLGLVAAQLDVQQTSAPSGQTLRAVGLADVKSTWVVRGAVRTRYDWTDATYMLYHPEPCRIRTAISSYSLSRRQFEMLASWIETGIMKAANR